MVYSCKRIQNEILYVLCKEDFLHFFWLPTKTVIIWYLKFVKKSFNDASTQPRKNIIMVMAYNVLCHQTQYSQLFSKPLLFYTVSVSWETQEEWTQSRPQHELWKDTKVTCPHTQHVVAERECLGLEMLAHTYIYWEWKKLTKPMHNFQTLCLWTIT